MKLAARPGLSRCSSTRSSRTDLYIADEVFFTGTAAEVVPIREVDDRLIGEPGPVTKRMQERFAAITAGKDDEFAGYMEYARK